MTYSLLAGIWAAGLLLFFGRSYVTSARREHRLALRARAGEDEARAELIERAYRNGDIDWERRCAELRRLGQT